MMNIKKLNLNLLLALDALLTEQHVSRAAKKIFITQPAISNSLNQLRGVFKDKLLIRSGRKMVLTPLAQTMAPKVAHILEQVREIIEPSNDFNPLTSHRIFSIAMPDYCELVFLPELFKVFAKSAPNIKLRIVPISTIDSADLFQEQSLDISLGFLKIHSPVLHQEKLFNEYPVCITSQKLKSHLTQKQFFSSKHIAITFNQHIYSDITDTALANMGLKRDIVVAVPHILAALLMAMQTPYIATVPASVAYALQSALGLTIKRLPFDLPVIPISMVWHKRFDNDPGHQWLRKQLMMVTKSIKL